MLRRILRAVATLLVFIIIGVVVVAATGGAFQFSGGVASCPAPADGGTGPVPAMVQGGYQVSFMLQAGDIVVQPSATLLVEPDTVRVTADRCRANQLARR